MRFLKLGMLSAALLAGCQTQETPDRAKVRMDQESAAATYEVFLKTLSLDGVPTRAGIDNLVKSIQAQGRFVDKKPAFSDIADDRLAREVAKELGYKVQ